jgi:hypothetical protein
LQQRAVKKKRVELRGGGREELPTSLRRKSGPLPFPLSIPLFSSSSLLFFAIHQIIIFLKGKSIV